MSREQLDEKVKYHAACIQQRLGHKCGFIDPVSFGLLIVGVINVTIQCCKYWGATPKQARAEMLSRYDKDPPRMRAELAVRVHKHAQGRLTMDQSYYMADEIISQAREEQHASDLEYMMGAMPPLSKSGEEADE